MTPILSVIAFLYDYFVKTVKMDKNVSWKPEFQKNYDITIGLCTVKKITSKVKVIDLSVINRIK